MTHVRIISVENTSLGDPGTSCDNYRHSKFVIRRKYVESQLIPAMQQMPYESVVAFQAVIDPDITDGPPQNGAYRTIIWKGVQFPVDVAACIPCFLSHYALWKECVTSGQCYFIMEDDARLPEDSAKLIYDTVMEYERGPYGGDVLYLLSAVPYSQFALRTYCREFVKPISDLLKRIIHHHDFAGTTAYVVRPQSAQALIDRTTKAVMTTPDGHLHRAFNEGLLGILAMAEDKRGLMLNDHWSEWNHVHDVNVR